jgi:hypothetical protein
VAPFTDRRTDGSLSNDFKCAPEANGNGREWAERTERILNLNLNFL